MRIIFMGATAYMVYAQRRLSLLSERGDGVQKDYAQAYIWYKLGAANGGNTGAMMRDELAIRMTSDQFAEGKSWRESGSRRPNERRPPQTRHRRCFARPTARKHLSQRHRLPGHASDLNRVTRRVVDSTRKE